MAGLAPAIHAVGRVERPETSSGEKPRFHKALQRYSVDGRVKPGHDDRGSMACERLKPANS
jgi:hypothetical protein